MAGTVQDSMAEFFDFGSISLPEGTLPQDAPQLQLEGNLTADLPGSVVCPAHPGEE